MPGTDPSDVGRGQYAALAVALGGCALAALLPSPAGRYAGAAALVLGAALQVPGARLDRRARAPIALFVGTALAAVVPGGGGVTAGIVVVALVAYVALDVAGRRS